LRVEQQVRKNVTWKEEYERKLERSCFRNAKMDGEAWMLGDPYKTQNARG
jgi:hypothetical protein